MNEELLKRAFGPERAEVYDAQNEPLRAMKDLVHLFLRVRFSRLPDDARVLLVGAGTGAEARFLAPLFPTWRFTLVDPAEGMLAVAERHARSEGFADRCTFHADYLSATPRVAHDAAASVLVSHFLTDSDARRAYFQDIAERLTPGGHLLEVCLAADREASDFEDAMDLWMETLAHTAPDGAAPSGFRSMFGRDVAVHGPAEVEGLMRAAGFASIVECYRAALMRGWLARRP